MPEEPYKNRELDEKFNNLDRLIREKHDDTMVVIGEVRVQTTYTNGKVTWLMKMVWLSIGFCSCVTIILIPLLLSLIQSGKI